VESRISVRTVRDLVRLLREAPRPDDAYLDVVTEIARNQPMLAGEDAGWSLAQSPRESHADVEDRHLFASQSSGGTAGSVGSSKR
jgi:hypothetical protein